MVPIPAHSGLFCDVVKIAVLARATCSRTSCANPSNPLRMSTGSAARKIRNAEGRIYVWDSADNRAKLWDDPGIGEFAIEGTFTVEGKACKPAFQRFKDILADFEWIDVTRQFVPVEEKIFSWWSYRNRDWKASNRGRRLDHIWVTPALKGSLKHFTITPETRDYESTSDHVPVLMELAA